MIVWFRNLWIFNSNKITWKFERNRPPEKRIAARWTADKFAAGPCNRVTVRFYVICRRSWITTGTWALSGSRLRFRKNSSKMLSLIRYVIEMLYGWIFTVEICTIIQNYFRTKLECSVALFYFNYINLRDLIWSNQR